jgi:drug/metabolite transporter (DMT)-like permease
MPNNQLPNNPPKTTAPATDKDEVLALQPEIPSPVAPSPEPEMVPQHRAAEVPRQPKALKTDSLLLLAALIWGVAFVAQKSALNHIGPYTFIAIRFVISALLILPLALREQWKVSEEEKFFTAPDLMRKMFMVFVAFSGAVILLQKGIADTSVTNAGFISGLYVLFVPYISWAFYGQRLSVWILPPACLSLIGVWFLEGGNLGTQGTFSKGDTLVLLSAIGFALHFVLIRQIMKKAHAPFRLACLQYFAVAAVTALAAWKLENPDIAHIKAAWLPIIYAGAISGAIAYTLEIVVMQYAPATYSAVILSTESVFAAFAGMLLLNEHLTLFKGIGCFLLMCAVLFAPPPPKRKQGRRATDPANAEAEEE